MQTKSVFPHCRIIGTDERATLAAWAFRVIVWKGAICRFARHGCLLSAHDAVADAGYQGR
jgi:hypothetical protein